MAPRRGPMRPLRALARPASWAALALTVGAGAAGVAQASGRVDIPAASSAALHQVTLLGQAPAAAAEPAVAVIDGVALERAERAEHAQLRREAAAAQVASLRAREAQLAKEAAARSAAVKEAARLEASKKDPRGVAADMAARRGWTGEQFTCLKVLWEKESNWRWHAVNPSSGAYGIPQALPDYKMASAGSDWATNPATQIKWGLAYIDERYGNPCNALYFHRGHNWY